MASETCTVRRYTDPAAFAARVEPWLLEREAEHNILLGLLPKLTTGRHEFDSPVYLAAIETGDEVVGYAFRTPPYKLAVSGVADGAADEIADEVASLYPSIPAVLGREADATRLAISWSRRVGCQWALGMRQRIHQLERLIEPATVPPGGLRQAGSSDRDVLVDWLDAFVRETRIGGSTGRVLADLLIGDGAAFLWDDGGPCALVGSPGRTPNGVRVGYVYTPPDHRRRGYATAAVAELSARMLASGRRYCFLYTDLANPTSNAIYARLGYTPVCDVVDVDFSSPGLAPALQKGPD